MSARFSTSELGLCDGRRLTHVGIVEVDAGDRVVELPKPAPQRPPGFRESLGAQDDESDDEDYEHLGQPDAENMVGA